jgi:hypothetical protein
MRTLLLTLTTCLLVLPAQAKYSGGSGTADDPYQIATAADLIAIGETPEDYDKHFVMTADIDLDPKLPGRKVFDKAVIAPDTEPAKDGFQGTPFSGVFDGKSHAVSHLTIMGQSCLGLLGQLASGAEVRDLGVVDVNISGSYNVGGLVGINWGHATQCYSTGAVSGNSSVGGLVGYNSGALTHCYSTGRVSGGSNVGGLVGDNYGGVTQCYSTDAVNGYGSVGGLVGHNDWNGSVTHCYSTGRVSGGSNVGGLVGDNWGGLVTHCYSTGAVGGSGYIGGLVGENIGTVIQCYSTGAVNGTGDVGGLVGMPGGHVTDCFWDTQTSGQAKSAGGIGKTTAEMQTAATFLSWGGCGPLWTIAEGRDYPHLAWENIAGQVIVGPTYGGGMGTAQNPYLIRTAEQLNTLGSMPCDLDKHFKLMADIDLSGFDGKEGRPAFNIVTPGGEEVDFEGGHYFWGTPFTGIFDGNGHTISRLTVKGAGYLGLFGQLGSGGEVKDLGVVDVNIVGSGTCVGGLAGEDVGASVTRCYSTGRVSGGSVVGGLVGQSDGGHVTQCYSTSVVSGGSFIGGLVGSNGHVGVGVPQGEGGIVTECYSTGAVSGTGCVGGLVGSNGSRWTPGAIVTQCFWDTQTSGQATSAGGTGKTTAEMQTAKTFLDSGWDFVGETANGMEDLWWIVEGKDYPRLWWEAHP